ncbi:MAG: gliding motility-associated C-terminal domain-containing protein [Bacteroidales bacterium]|jgi:gliding motility-associated-like protein|nr:gliding motility-associated C-terminal domain-containing protein [Bacteroidales bacterium]
MKQLTGLIFGLIFVFSASAQQYNMPTQGQVSYSTDECWVYDDGGQSGNYGSHSNGTMIVSTASPGRYFNVEVSYDIEPGLQSSFKIYNGSNGQLIFSKGTYDSVGTFSGILCSREVRIVFSNDGGTPHSGFEIHLTSCRIPPPMVSGLFADNFHDAEAEANCYQSDSSFYVRWGLIAGIDDYTVAVFPSGADVSDLSQATLTPVHAVDSFYVSGFSTCDTVMVQVFPTEYMDADVCHPCTSLPTTRAIMNPCRCHPPSITVAPYTDDTSSNIPIEEMEDSIRVSWDSVPGVGTYMLVYWDASVQPIEPDTVMITGLDTIFATLEHCHTYIFKVITPCSNTDCDDRPEPPQSTWLHCLCSVPNITSMSVINGSDLLVQWTEQSDTLVWTIIAPNGSTIDNIDTNFVIIPGVITDTCDTAYAVIVFNNCHNLPFDQICTQGTNTITFVCDDCPLPLADVINQVMITTNQISITWSNDEDTLSWMVLLYQNDTLLIDVDTVTGNQVSFTNLIPETNYTIWIHAFSPSIDTCNGKRFNYTTFGNCIDYTNLTSPNVTPTIGTYSNPYQLNTLVNNGANNITSRHTVNTDTLATDPRTGNNLKTVPDGYTSSVRLGNWEKGAQGESLTYTYFVDTNMFDLLLLRYALVLQNDSAHRDTTQPSFTLEILDSSGTLIDNICGKTEFVAGVNMEGWNSADNLVRWKDWTAAGLNLSPYHNKKIKVRLTTKDCKESGHYGYAYFVFECNKKQLTSVACGESSANTFIAPEGFAYKWYNELDTNTILSTDRQFDVMSQGTQHYFCIVTSLENPLCSFRINATAGNRYPIADFDYTYTFQDCKFNVTFTNRSYVASDSSGLYSTGESCETAQWFLEGDSSSSNSFTRTYSSSGDYRVILIAGLANNSCVDTLDTIIHLESPVGSLSIIGDTSICYGESTTLTATMYGTYLWNTNATTQSITVSPFNTTLYSVQVLDTLGCTNNAERIVVVNPHYNNINVYDTICEGDYYAPEGTPLTISGVYHLNLTTIAGCDSIINLNLTVNPTYHDTIYDSICQYETYEFYGQQYDSTGIYDTVFQSIHGCDSVHILNLVVKPVYIDTIKADIYKGRTFSRYGFTETETGIYNQTFVASNGCDSIIVLDLTVDNISFPNAISANDDGVNDVFAIRNLIEDTVFKDNELWIYNRYGKLVYHRKNISKESDFWKPDASTPTGTYFYRFKAVRHDKTMDVTGTVDVLR